MARLNGVFGGVLAPESWTASQSFFYGMVSKPLRFRRGDAPPGKGADFETRIVEGTRCIDQADDLDAGAIGKNGQRRGNGVDADAEHVPGSKPEAPIDSIAEALERTLATGLTHFWSRSRRALWQKG